MTKKQSNLPAADDIAQRQKAAVLDMVSQGGTLTEICSLSSAPSRRQVFVWIDTDKKFATSFAVAEQRGADALADQAHLVAQNTSPETAAADRLRVMQLQWRCSRFNSRYAPPHADSSGLSSSTATDPVDLSDARTALKTMLDDRAEKIHAAREASVLGRIIGILEPHDSGLKRLTLPADGPFIIELVRYVLGMISDAELHDTVTPQQPGDNIVTMPSPTLN